MVYCNKNIENKLIKALDGKDEAMFMFILNEKLTSIETEDKAMGTVPRHVRVLRRRGLSLLLFYKTFINKVRKIRLFF